MQDNVEDAIQEVQDVVDDLDTNKLDKTSVKDTYSTSATDTYSCNYVNENIQDVFSTNETKTNKVWNGKPVYRKVFEATGPSGASSVAVSMFNLPANTERVWIDLGNSYWYTPNTIKPVLTLNWYYTSEDWCRISIYSTDVRVKTGSTVNLTNFKYTITLQYTKTTD